MTQQPSNTSTGSSIYNIVALPGDGVGPEIMAIALNVLNEVSHQFGFTCQVSTHPIGGDAIDQTGEPLPESTRVACQAADAVLLGAVGGPKWDNQPPPLRPEAGLLALRKTLELYCNLRPVKTFDALIDACPIKCVTAEKPLDLMIVRELTGGIYFGDRGTSAGDDPAAWDIEKYHTSEITAIANVACDLAQSRSGKLTSIDKANVLESSRLWRKTVETCATTKKASQEGGSTISLNHLYVDNCAMQLILNPHQFDVILTNNIFGDILSDEASTLVGSIGLMPSASLGTQK